MIRLFARILSRMNFSICDYAISQHATHRNVKLSSPSRALLGIAVRRLFDKSLNTLCNSKRVWLKLVTTYSNVTLPRPAKDPCMIDEIELFESTLWMYQSWQCIGGDKHAKQTMRKCFQVQQTSLLESLWWSCYPSSCQWHKSKRIFVDEVGINQEHRHKNP